MLALQQLISPPTEDEALESLLVILRQLGIQTTAWQSGGVQLLFVRMFAKVWAAIGGTIATVAAGGFTTLASSPYLQLLAKYFYNIDYIPAQQAVGKFLLTSSAGAPVHTFAAGDMIVANAEEGTDGAVTFTCTEGGTLNPSSTLEIEFKADVAGTASNIAPDTDLFFWTPYVGVTVTNPALLPESNTWITTPGENEESDARLIARCIARWTWLSYGNVDGAYAGWALEALPALTRIGVEAAPGDGTVTLYGATALGPLTAPQCATIEDYVNGVTDGIGRRPINDIFSAEPAVLVSSPALVYTVYATSSYVATVGALAEADVLAFIGVQPLGGVRLQGTQGRVLFDDLLNAAKYLPAASRSAPVTPRPGVRSVKLNITTDVLLSPGEFYSPSVTVTVLPVAPGVA